MKYYIYQLNIGKASYVGKTTQNNPDTRLRQHLKLLRENRHHTKILQREWNLTKTYDHAIIRKGCSLFNYKIALVEQRMIDKYSNSNESRVVRSAAFSSKELIMDLIDFSFYQFKFIVVGFIIVFSILYSSL